MHDVALERKAEAYYRGTLALRDLVADRVVPVLVAILKKSDHDEAVVGTYYRMHLWMLDLGKLNYPVHFQAVLNATRGMFELLVDLKLLVDDPALADKYHAFPFVARFSAAKKLIDYLNTDRTYSPPAKPEKRRIFISDGANQKKFDDLRKEHWGTDKKGDLITPSHWSNLDLAARVGRLGSAESRRYRDIYSMCSWFVHSGAAGIAGISPDGLLAAFGWGHGKIQEMFAEGTEILCKTLHLFTASPGLQQELELAKVAPAIFLDPELTGPPSNS